MKAACYRVMRKQLVCTARPTQTVGYMLDRDRHLDGAETPEMILRDEAYNAALEIFEQAIAAFAAGSRERAEHLLTILDCEAIERDREQLQAFGRTGTAVEAVIPVDQRDCNRISAEIKKFARERDGYRCRFTGRRLIDARVFREVHRLSKVFHFDEHYAVRPTKRGPGGHPLTRTHGAAYEHAVPLCCGGRTSRENIVLISVELNEAKSATILELIEVPIDDWCGLTQYLPGLRKQPSVVKKPEPPPARPVVAPRAVVPTPPPRPGKARTLARMREAAEGLAVRVFALDLRAEDEAEFRELRSLEKNAYFATKAAKAGTWRIHCMYCSALDFDIDVKLTASPKVYSEHQEPLVEWARRIRANPTGCSRCGTAV